MFLEIKGLRKSFGTDQNRTEVLKGIDFAVEKGEICVLLGPSGSGKSTLLNIIGGIDGADSGQICINGEMLEDMNEKTLTQYRRKHLGYVFQMYNLIPNLNVRENIEVGAYLSDHPLDIEERTSDRRQPGWKLDLCRTGCLFRIYQCRRGCSYGLQQGSRNF